MRPLRIVLACVIVSVMFVGCQQGQFRNIDAVEAEQQALKATVPFASAYKAQHPAETPEVDAFYRRWQGRIDAERSAAGSTTAPAIR